MRAIGLALCLGLAACGGDITPGGGGDDSGGDDDDDGNGVDAAPGGPDAFPADEPPGLVGVTAAHNQVRAAHGVAPLTWSPALAATAQAWADACVDNAEPLGLVDHNPGRSDGHEAIFGYVGENVYGSGGAASGTDAVALWASEEADYDYATNECSDICGHYTQVVWAATTHVGCGISQCAGFTYGGTVVCNYGPGGNNGGRPY